LIERFRRGENPVLIVDEAQGLSFELLEEIRLLLNLETASEKLLQIVLARQPELEDKLKRPELRQLRQRITLRCGTAPFTLKQSHGYITERLRIGGATGDPIFASDAMDAVHFYSQGIPRIINLLCENALINAYVEHFRLVPARVVEEVAHEFFLDEGRQFETRRNSAAVVSSNPAVMHSIVVNGLARLFAAEEANFLEPSGATSPAELDVLVAIEGAALTARNNTVTTARRREAISPSIENSNAPDFLKDFVPASVGPEVKLKESELCLESIACVSRSGPPLTINQLSRSSPRTPIYALLPSWKSWRLDGMNGFSSAISLAEWSHVSFRALRSIRQSTFRVQALLRRWKFEFRLDWTAMINTIALPEMKKSFLRWLR
jgi:hypothetical protein